MTALLDLLPIIVFFIAYAVDGIVTATAAAIVAAVAVAAVCWYRQRTLSTTQIITLAALVLFGGATLISHDPVFIMYKVTIINWLFALAVLLTPLVTGGRLLPAILLRQLPLPPPVQRRLNLLWLLFFLTVGAANWWFADRAVHARQALLAVDTAIDELTAIDCHNRYADGATIAQCLQAQQTERHWVAFKLYGTLGCTVLFLIGHIVILRRVVSEADDAQ